MKNWKALFLGVLILCLLPVAMPFASVRAEEETEDPIPESYYYAIESNETSGWPQ